MLKKYQNHEIIEFVFILLIYNISNMYRNIIILTKKPKELYLKIIRIIHQHNKIHFLKHSVFFFFVSYRIV